MELVKEITTKTYKCNETGCVAIFQEDIEQYHYRDEEEKIGHAKQMKDRGFEDGGQVEDNIGTVMNPDYVWFGSYYRLKEIKWNGMIILR